MTEFQKTVIRRAVGQAIDKSAEIKKLSASMNLNATNSKTIQKIYKTPYIEDWIGRKIQIFATPVKVGKEVVDALRIKPFVPQQTVTVTKCADCNAEIQGAGKLTAQQVAQYTYQKYGKSLCSDCATKVKAAEDAQKIPDPLADKEPGGADQGEPEEEGEAE